MPTLHDSDDFDLHRPPRALLRWRSPAWWRRLDKSPLQRALTLAVLEAGVVAGLVAVNEAWIVPLLVERLHASPAMVGLLTIVPMLIAMIVGPIVGPIIAAIGGNKQASLWTCWAQIACMAALSLPLQYSDQPWAMPLGLALAIGINAVGSFGGPAWLSWMGELIPRTVRGRYFSNRMRVHHLMRLTFAGGFALLMQAFPASGSTIGLQILLAIAAVSRLASVLLMMRQHEPEPRPRLRGETARVARSEGRGFLVFLRSMPRTDVGRWTLVWAAMHFGATVAGPYFQPYMLIGPERGGLGLAASPLLYTLLVYLSTIIRLVSLPVVGRVVDRFGPAPILRIAVVGITLVPFGWAATASIPLILATEVVSGLSWCMAECAVSVLLFGCSGDPQHRARLIGYHQSVCCAAIVLGSTLGGTLLKADILPPLDGSAFRTLFVLSALARVPSVLLALRFLPELADRERVAGLWRWIPGLEPTIILGREVVKSFRRA